MSQPIVIAYHLVWTTYGSWLPNDPRGSHSITVHNNVLAELGEFHNGRKKIQPAGREIRDFYRRAAPLLQHPLLTFDEPARSEIAAAFGAEIEKERYTCWACAVMPDHIHVLIRKHKHQAEEMAENLMRASRSRLIETGHRDQTHPTWTAGFGWKVFLEHPNEVRRTIRYIELNPVKIGLPGQSWPFVRKYDGWPLHPGHSSNSPYVKRLRDAGYEVD
jgi:REP element-mobilizing transposase RayT